MKLKTYLLLLLSALALTFTTQAQDEQPELTQEEAEAEFQAYLDSFNWTTSGAGNLQNWATIEVPEGFRFLNGKDTDTIMQDFGNVPDDYVGMIAVNDMDWFVLFQFEDTGYVKDDEKDDLNADKILKDLHQVMNHPTNIAAKMA